MREIKFRAWDGQDTMIYFDFNSIRHDGLIDWNENKYSDTGGGLYIDNCNVMQYTGLQDKTGRDIFDGDIVETDTENIVSIKYNNDFGAYQAGGFPLTKRDIEELNIEIIGNIYENPELLDNK